VDAQLHDDSRALREVGQDVLHGDFSCLPALQALIRERNQEIQRERSRPS
jgi:hypothetical protein